MFRFCRPSDKLVDVLDGFPILLKVMDKIINRREGQSQGSGLLETARG